MRARRTKDTVEVYRTQILKGLESLSMVWGFCLEATEGVDALKPGWWFNQISVGNVLEGSNSAYKGTR